MIRYDIKRSIFFNELSFDNQQEYFYQSQYKYLPNIDNIYYTVSIVNDYNGNKAFDPLFHELLRLRQISLELHEPIEFMPGLSVDLKMFQIYKFCLTCTDLYDIFVLDYLPNPSTPRFLIQIRSHGLWHEGWEVMLDKSFKHIESLCANYNIVIDKCMENRIDYCFHTNIIKEPEKTFSDRKLTNSLETTMGRYHVTGRISKYENGKTALLKDYFALGVRKSNNVFIRFYNKSLEVIEIGRKGYFFKIWQDNGLINAYDMFCFEYAYKEKDYNYINSARLEFYLLHGKNEELKSKFKIALKNNISSEIKDLANSYMPDVTKVLNIEFETKRKFYYYSDQQINDIFKIFSRSNPPDPPLHRLYKIFDNRKIFIEYITRSVVSFKNSKGDYLDFWSRLRCLKLDCIKTDLTLVRDYSHKLDKEVLAKRLVNSIASNAVYQGKDYDTGFIEDITDILSNINDNDKFKVNISYLSEDGSQSEDFYSHLLNDYKTKKLKVRKRIKNKYGEDKIN